MLPAEVASNEMLLHLCRKMVAADPAKRFASAQAADLDRRGAAIFIGNSSSTIWRASMRSTFGIG